MPRRGGRRRRDEAVERSRRCRAVQAQIKRRRKLLHALNRALRHRGGAEALHSSDRFKSVISKFGTGPLHKHVKAARVCCGTSLVHVICENVMRVSRRKPGRALKHRIAVHQSYTSSLVSAKPKKEDEGASTWASATLNSRQRDRHHAHHCASEISPRAAEVPT